MSITPISSNYPRDSIAETKEDASVSVDLLANAIDITALDHRAGGVVPMARLTLTKQQANRLLIALADALEDMR
jgi:hypothetical protein